LRHQAGTKTRPQAKKKLFLLCVFKTPSIAPNPAQLARHLASAQRHDPFVSLEVELSDAAVHEDRNLSLVMGIDTGIAHAGGAGKGEGRWGGELLDQTEAAVYAKRSPGAARSSTKGSLLQKRRLIARSPASEFLVRRTGSGRRLSCSGGLSEPKKVGRWRQPSTSV
jgi:hypothetical protein